MRTRELAIAGDQLHRGDDKYSRAKPAQASSNAIQPARTSARRASGLAKPATKLTRAVAPAASSAIAIVPAPALEANHPVGRPQLSKQLYTPARKLISSPQPAAGNASRHGTTMNHHRGGLSAVRPANDRASCFPAPALPLFLTVSVCCRGRARYLSTPTQLHLGTLPGYTPKPTDGSGMPRKKIDHLAYMLHAWANRHKPDVIMVAGAMPFTLGAAPSEGRQPPSRAPQKCPSPALSGHRSCRPAACAGTFGRLSPEGTCTAVGAELASRATGPPNLTALGRRRCEVVASYDKWLRAMPSGGRAGRRAGDIRPRRTAAILSELTDLTEARRGRKTK
jgi:hypothetical protein